ncbi:hypothetical protein F5144DRAFT_22265 [Chaetomium tenue]|uniref:Uncharacterized protein n=1 Tax=Chaetomium tenue TaxID=1854479 RepID=A0ACB7PLQ1_9PEZI|nr:hypothetical protein F5144DRAFT_22265 [Chaetomium globosum]
METSTFGLRVSASQWGLWSLGVRGWCKPEQAKRDHGAPNAKLGTAHGGLSAWQSRRPKAARQWRSCAEEWAHFVRCSSSKVADLPPPIGGQGDGGVGTNRARDEGTTQSLCAMAQTGTAPNGCLLPASADEKDTGSHSRNAQLTRPPVPETVVASA